MTTTKSFLDPNYTVPVANGKYLKFEIGETRFRALSSPIVGNEFWVDKKPIRRRIGDPIRTDENVRHFWALPVFDYGSRAVKILEITQKGIMQAVTALSKDGDWGTPLEYDLVVNREGEGMETKYTVLPKPAKPLMKDAQDAWNAVQEAGFNLEALFTGDDPFAPSVAASEEKDEDPLPDEEVNIDDIDF